MFLTGSEPCYNEGLPPIFVWSILKDLEGSEICWQVERDGWQTVCRQCWRTQKKLAEKIGRQIVRVK